MKTLKPGIYAILDGGNFDQLVRRGLILMEFPISALQIRAKSLGSLQERRKLAQDLFNSYRQKKVDFWFVINDDIELAKEFKVPVHLGQEDLQKVSFAKTQEYLGPHTPIGISTHSLQEAFEAQKMGASYIGFGPMFKTKSKENALSPRPLSDLIEISKKIFVPIVAIGGIHFQNMEKIISHGIHRIAMCSAIGDLIAKPNDCP
jgi:thiamine-phosphate diphosphorylase